LTYTRHGYAGLVGLKNLVFKARVPPLGLENPMFDTLRFTLVDM